MTLEDKRGGGPRGSRSSHKKIRRSSALVKHSGVNVEFYAAVSGMVQHAYGPKGSYSTLATNCRAARERQHKTHDELLPRLSRQGKHQAHPYASFAPRRIMFYSAASPENLGFASTGGTHEHDPVPDQGGFIQLYRGSPVAKISESRTQRSDMRCRGVCRR